MQETRNMLVENISMLLSQFAILCDGIIPALTTHVEMSAWSFLSSSLRMILTVSSQVYRETAWLLRARDSLRSAMRVRSSGMFVPCRQERVPGTWLPNMECRRCPDA